MIGTAAAGITQAGRSTVAFSECLYDASQVDEATKAIKEEGIDTFIGVGKT